MKNKKIGVIGAGNMGKVLIRSIVKSGICYPGNITVNDLSRKNTKELKEELHIVAIDDNVNLVKESEIVILAVKPQSLEGVLCEIKDFLSNKLVISIAAGISTRYIENIVGTARIVRVMPNLLYKVKKGASAFCLGKYATEEDKEDTEKIFSQRGICLNVDESEMDVITALSGSGPAFIYSIVDSLKKGAVIKGLDEDKAHRLTLQMIRGACRMIENNTEDIDTLIRKVASKGGTTAEGLRILKEKRVDEALKSCIHAATEKSGDMEKYIAKNEEYKEV